MSMPSQNVNTGKIFGAAAKDAGFLGNTVTRYRDHDKFLLVINHQKSAFGRRFYLNVGLYFREMLDEPLDETAIRGAFKVHTTTPLPHVSWRIEMTPGMPADVTQEHLDSLVVQNDVDQLRKTLSLALGALLTFVAAHADRKALRQLSDARLFNAMILKEV